MEISKAELDPSAVLVADWSTCETLTPTRSDSVCSIFLLLQYLARTSLHIGNDPIIGVAVRVLHVKYSLSNVITYSFRSKH
jgi:hypothetical protein